MNVLTIFNSRRLAVCNCNCEHYRTKFYFGIWCQNKVIIIIIIISAVVSLVGASYATIFINNRSMTPNYICPVKLL